MNQLNRTCKFTCAVCVCVGLRYIRAHISMSTYTRVCAYFMSAVLCVCAMYLRTCVRAYTLCTAVVGASACARAVSPSSEPVQPAAVASEQRRRAADAGASKTTQHNTPQGRHLNRSLCGQSAAAPPQDRRYGVRIVREATWRSCGRGFRAASVPARCVFIGAIERDCTGLNDDIDVHVCLVIGARTQVQGCCARVHV